MIPVRGYDDHMVAVLGLGRSGLATARALRAGGATAVCWDDNPEARAAASDQGFLVADLTKDKAWDGVVALITGEERIVPGRAQYWVCTVEAMPLDIGADFVAIDEIQLCADPDRGHVFTVRLLGARGLHETLFLGADTMRPAIAALVPGVQFVARERFSELTSSGSKKISRMASGKPMNQHR